MLRQNESPLPEIIHRAITDDEMQRMRRSRDLLNEHGINLRSEVGGASTRPPERRPPRPRIKR
jgi:hypothetical protein